MKAADRFHSHRIASLETDLVIYVSQGHSLRSAGQRFSMSWRAAREIVDRRAPYLLSDVVGPDHQPAIAMPCEPVHRPQGCCPGELVSIIAPDTGRALPGQSYDQWSDDDDEKTTAAGRPGSQP